MIDKEKLNGQQTKIVRMSKPRIKIINLAYNCSKVSRLSRKVSSFSTINFSCCRVNTVCILSYNLTLELTLMTMSLKSVRSFRVMSVTLLLLLLHLNGASLLKFKFSVSVKDTFDIDDEP